MGGRGSSREREMKRRNEGGEEDEGNGRGGEQEDRRATYASEDPARTHRRGRSVGSSQLTDY